MSDPNKQARRHSYPSCPAELPHHVSSYKAKLYEEK
jgi:hypothetical protein